MAITKVAVESYEYVASNGNRFSSLRDAQHEEISIVLNMHRHWDTGDIINAIIDNRVELLKLLRSIDGN